MAKCTKRSAAGINLDGLQRLKDIYQGLKNQSIQVQPPKVSPRWGRWREIETIALKTVRQSELICEHRMFLSINFSGSNTACS